MSVQVSKRLSLVDTKNPISNKDVQCSLTNQMQHFGKYCHQLVLISDVKNWSNASLKQCENDLNQLIKDLKLETELKLEISLPFTMTEYKQSICSYLDTLVSDLKDVKDFLKNSSENSSPLKNYINPIRSACNKLDNHEWKTQSEEMVYKIRSLYYYLFHEIIGESIHVDVITIESKSTYRWLFYLLYLSVSGGLIYLKKIPIFYMSLIVPLLYECGMWIKSWREARLIKTKIKTKDDLKPVLNEMLSILTKQQTSAEQFRKSLRDLNDKQLYQMQSLGTTPDMRLPQVIKAFELLKEDLNK